MELRKVILVMGMDIMTQEKFRQAGHKLVSVNKENGGSFLRDLILDRKENLKPSEDLPNEKVMVLSGYDEDELREFVIALRSIRKEIRPMLAVVTESSYNWPFEYLVSEHLVKDREEMRKYEEERRKNGNN